MNGSALYSDVVLPAATWYEKHDLSSTDLHPFVHSFNAGDAAAVGDAHRLRHLRADRRVRSRGSPRRTSACTRDLVAAPLLHDTPDELAQPFGEVRDWKRGECEPVPGQDDAEARRRSSATTPPCYRQVARARARSSRSSASSAKGIALEADAGGRGAAAPRTATLGRTAAASTRDVHWCETILALSGVTNGRLAVEGFRALEERTGTRARRPRRGARRRPHHVRRHAGAAAQGDRLARVVGHRSRATAATRPSRSTSSATCRSAR